MMLGTMHPTIIFDRVRVVRVCVCAMCDWNVLVFWFVGHSAQDDNLNLFLAGMCWFVGLLDIQLKMIKFLVLCFVCVCAYVAEY